MDDDGCQFLPRIEGCDCILDFDHQLFKLEVVQNKPLYVYAGFYGTNILTILRGIKARWLKHGVNLEEGRVNQPQKRFLSFCHF